MAKIKKPDANPIVALLLSFFVLQLGHMVINGQTRKWVFILVAQVLGLLACCVGSPIIGIMGLIEAYKTAERLKNGEELEENEYSFAPLYKIIKFIDKTAVGPSEPPAPPAA